MKSIIVIAALLASGSVLASDVDPAGFEKEHFNSSLSRADAVALSKRASAPSIRIDDQGRAIVAPSTLPRAQVAAETREAQRLGLIRYGEMGSIQPTAEQEQQIKVAGQRAVGSAVSE